MAGVTQAKAWFTKGMVSCFLTENWVIITRKTPVAVVTLTTHTPLIRGVAFHPLN